MGKRKRQMSRGKKVSRHPEGKYFGGFVCNINILVCRKQDQSAIDGGGQD